MIIETFGRERSCVIDQEPFCGVRTHFYHDGSSYDMFRDHRVVEVDILFHRILSDISVLTGKVTNHCRI